MLSKGIHPKVVSERLGHASIGITLDTYSHVLPVMQAEGCCLRRALPQLRALGEDRTTAVSGAVTSGNPKRIARRGRNIILGRAMARAGIWRALWR